MFSKNLLRFSSFGSHFIKVIPKCHSTPILLRSVQNNRYSMNRFLSDSTQHFVYELPPLMEFDDKNMGSPFVTPFKIKFYFKPYFDKSFDTKRFLEGAKQAVSVISSLLANNNIEGIKPFVIKEAYEEISKNYKTYTSEQKLKLKVNFEDIIQCFIYNLQIDKRSKNEWNIRFVVIFDVLNNSRDTKTLNKIQLIGRDFKFLDLKHNIKLMEPILDQKIFCIYEFSRDYDKSGALTDWIVTKLVHFKNKDIWRLKGFI